MAPDAQRHSEPPDYKPYGVLYHHGESACGVDVVHSNGDGDAGEVWLHMGDEAVTRMGHGYVFGERDELAAEERCAYLFFYCRTFPIGTS